MSDLLLSCRNLTLGSTHFLLLHPFKGMDLAKRRVDIHEGHFDIQGGGWDKSVLTLFT